MRADSLKNGNAVQKVNEILKELNIPLVKNFNIVKKHLENRGLHLNEHGTLRLAMNYIATIRKLRSNVGYAKCDFDLKPIKPTETFKTIESNCKEGPFEILKKIQVNNVSRVVIGHVNINSIRSKFDIVRLLSDMLSSMVKDNMDILMVSETKLDSSLPQAQFRIEGYVPPFRYDRNSYGGGILLFIREDILTKIISIPPLKDFKGIFVELNFRKKKNLLCCSYNPHKNLISNHLNILGKILEKQMKIYGNFLIVGDFNSEMTESAMENFRGTYHLHNLINDLTCFTNPDKPSCIDLLLTNFPKSFLKSQTLETGLSDFHKLTLTVFKIHYKKQRPLIVTYRDYKTSQMEVSEQNF